MGERGGKILIVCTNELCRLYQEHYESLGCAVEFAGVETDILVELNAALAGGAPFSSLLVDVGLGEYDFENLLDGISKQENLTDLSMLVGAPDAREGDAQMLIMIGFSEVVLHSTLLLQDESLLKDGEGSSGLVGESGVMLLTSDPSILKIIKFVLKRLKIRCDALEDCKEALRNFQQRIYSVVIIDIESFDSNEVDQIVSAARRTSGATVGVGIFGLVAADKVQACQQYEFDAILKKPVDTTVAQVYLKRFL